MVKVPFDKVAIGLIGPLKPVSDRGHRWILMLVNCATHYPEAVALGTFDTSVGRYFPARGPTYRTSK